MQAASHATSLVHTVAKLATTIQKQVLSRGISRTTALLVFLAPSMCTCVWVETCSLLNVITCGCAQELAESCFPPSVSAESALMYGKQDSRRVPMCVL